MRRSFLLTVVGGVLVTLAGCGGEVATETASTSSTSSSSSATPGGSSAPSSGPGASSAPQGGPGGSTPQSGPGGSSRSGPGGPQSGPGGPQSGPGGAPPGMQVMTGPGSSSGGSSANPMSYPGGSGPGGPQSGPGGSGASANPMSYPGGSGPGGPQSGPGGVVYPPGGYPGGSGGQSGPGGPQSGPGGYPGSGSGVPLPGNPIGVQVGAGGGSSTPTTTGPGQSGPGGPPTAPPTGQEQGAGTQSVGESIPFGPGGRPPGGPGPMSGPGGGPMGPGGYPGYPGAPGQAQAAPIPEPKNLKEKSELAFQLGRDDEGFQYMYAWFVADPDGESDNDLRLFTPTNLPHAALRIGIGIEHDVTGNLAGAPPTIGAEPNVLPSAGNNTRGGRPGAAGNPGEGTSLGGPGQMRSSIPGAGGPAGAGGGFDSEPSDPLGQFNYLTGTLGEKVVAELQELRTSREAPFGSFLRGISVEWPRQSARPGGATYPGGASGPNGAPFGPTGVQVGAGGGQTYTPPGAPGAPAAGAVAGLPRDPDSNQLIPGVVWLGKKTKQRLLDDARDAGLDLVIYFDTKISVTPSNGQEKNVTTIYLLNVNAVDTKEQVLGKTRPLNSVQVWTEMQKSREPIADALEQMFEMAEGRGMKLTDLPELQPDQAKARVDSIVSSTPDDVLIALAEVKYFHRESLINDADLLSAYESLLGSPDKAETLATGTAEEREAILEEWLPAAR